MEDETNLYGVYDGGELYPAKWTKDGHFMPQDPSKPEYKTALDLILPTPVRINATEYA